MERFSKRKSLVEKIIGFAFLSSYLLLRIKLNSLHGILEWFLDKFDPALKMKFLRQVLSPVKRASGEEIVGEELEKKEEDETERIETRNLNGLCPLFAAARQR